jgi:hypothetical protein
MSAPYKGTEIRKDLLSQVEQAVCFDRQVTHGRPENNFADIALMWQTYKDVPFTAQDVAAMMALVKIARLKWNPAHQDNWIDLAGYAICGGGLPIITPCETGQYEQTR